MAGEQWSCQQFEDAKSGRRYFVSIARRAAAGGEGSADLALTDGNSQAWTAQGLTSEEIKGQSPDKLRHLLAALSELEAADMHYQAEAAPREDGSLALRVAWQKNPAAPRVFITATLAAAAQPGAVIADMLGLLVGNLAALQAASLSLLQQNKAFEQQVARSQELVDKYVRGKEAQDRENNVKVAALLNSKKKKLRELQAKLDEAQEELKRLREGGAAMEEDGADLEDDGRPGHSRQGRAMRVVSDSPSEDSDEDEDEAERRPTPGRDG